jgi:hypothetical protein
MVTSPDWNIVAKYFYLVLAVLLALMLFADLSADATNAKDTSAERLEIEIERLPELPYEQEMLLLTIRGFYPHVITLNKLESPSFRNFSWMQLGRDRWFEVPGKQLRGFERTMAIFPQRAGNLTINRFTHHLTVFTAGGSREKRDVSSDAFTLEVRAKPPATEWWFPARSVRVTDQWDRPPDQLAPGATAVRTVTLEAYGAAPEMLPPMPRMRAPTLITFADLGDRTSSLTPQGPISRVVWRWTFKTATSASVDLDAVVIPWFDTAKRQHREIVLAPQRIALADSMAEDSASFEILSSTSPYVVPLGLFTGFVVALMLLLPGLHMKSRKEISAVFHRYKPDQRVWAIRYAAWKNDPARLRLAVHRLIRDDRQAGEHDPLPPSVEAHLARINAGLYSLGSKPGPAMDLRGFVRKFLSYRRHARSGRANI